ncbi:histidine kinase [Streptomyces sp. DSM 44917]|uniref:histidine kinase n=1 Tax=Streptomyces boetiae TaxID=3075541 RepID=A0ABU2LAL3_9ACTN|nr:histidine kinase [Streptomyces sp. DSM 44917]MDT0308600.1 histidine kinase [Streptomyces sp. DSM 44917]
MPRSSRSAARAPRAPRAVPRLNAASLRAFLLRDPASRRVLRQDAVVAAAVAAVCATAASLGGLDGRSPDALGWPLLAVAVLPLVWRRWFPMAVLLAHLGFVAAYHAMDYDHLAPFTASALAMYTVASAGPRRRSLAMAGAVLLMVTALWTVSGNDVGAETLRTSGWILAVIALGEAVRLHGQYLAALRERAQREAARRIAEERVRIARDLHDLLAHSITLIGVRSSVASHLLIADPERLDRAALAEALDGIAETCRSARADLRTTLQALREDGAPADGEDGPLPGLAGLPDLARTAEAAGARVDLTVDPDPPTAPPVIGAAAYRIVQEALTNAVRHAGPQVHVQVTVRRTPDDLLVTVEDGGPARAGAERAGAGDTPAPARPAPAGRPGTGLPGGAEPFGEREAPGGAVPLGSGGARPELPGGAESSGGPEASGQSGAELPGGAGRSRLPSQPTAPGRAAPSGRRGPRPAAPGAEQAGPNGQAAPAGYGLAGMRERARSVGGSLEAGPPDGRPGFAVTARLPIEEGPR